MKESHLQMDELPIFSVGKDEIEFLRPRGRAQLGWASLAQKCAEGVIGETDLDPREYDKVCAILHSNISHVNGEPGTIALSNLQEDLPPLTVIELFVEYQRSLQLKIKQKKS